MSARLLLRLLLGLLGLAACVPLAAPSPLDPADLPQLSPTPTVTPFIPLPPTALPLEWQVHTAPPPTLTSTPSPTPLPTPTLPPTATPQPPSPSPAAASLTRPRYRLLAIADYRGRRLTVDEQIDYPNLTQTPLSSLVLAVEPNRWSGCFTLEGLWVEEIVPSYSLDGHRLEITLPTPLAPGATLRLRLKYTLDLPPQSLGEPFGYTSWQQNYTNWYPFIVPYRQGGLLHDPWSYGEHLVYEAADFELRLSVPSGVIVAASAPPSEDAGALTYTLSAARTFVFSLSPYYQVSEMRWGNVPVRSYFLAADRAAGEHLTLVAVRCLTLYGAHLAPYPYPSLSVVAADLGDGREFDGLVFLPRRFYQQFDGGMRNNLSTLGVHEIAHQWWFGAVGNDQALEPWLDEALALYSEGLFYEWSENAADWWWNFRVNYFQPRGWVDLSIYESGGFRPYTDAVYLRGAQFLHALRRRIGDEAFFAFLGDYYRQMQGGIAARADFFRILSTHTSADLDDLLREYFRVP